MKKDRNNRRQQILQSLALMLENEPGERITTAKLAQQVGVSEAALYRHFPSKGKIFEGLIEFIEESLFTRINTIRKEDVEPEERIRRIIVLCLMFAQKNPGMCRMLMGDVLAGETARLRDRITQIFERLETEFRSVVRDAELLQQQRCKLSSNDAALMFVTLVEGRIHRFVRSEFKSGPLQSFQDHWVFMRKGLFASVFVSA